jgi:hypothetical protein
MGLRKFISVYLVDQATHLRACIVNRSKCHAGPVATDDVVWTVLVRAFRQCDFYRPESPGAIFKAGRIGILAPAYSSV